MFCQNWRGRRALFVRAAVALNLLRFRRMAWFCQSADLPFCGLPCAIMAEHHAGTRIRPARDTDILRACGGAALSRRFVEIISLSPNGFVLPTGGDLPKIAARKAPRTGFH
jgi:hypothetical protein